MDKQIHFRVSTLIGMLFAILMVTISYGIAVDDPRNSCAIGIPVFISLVSLIATFEDRYNKILFIINKKGDLL